MILITFLYSPVPELSFLPAPAIGAEPGRGKGGSRRHSGKMTAHALSRLRDFRARRNGRHRNKPRQNGGKLKFPASVLFSPRIRSSQTS